jgi:E3 ubiquitin-protein ligase SHPRH
VECFLLHARAHSSGLNLVNATHVILTEPLINTALELQAIARVHRIGQHRPTTVWMYLVSDTVEGSVYDISVERRLAHVRSSRKRDSVVGSSKATSGTATPQARGDNIEIETAIDAANEAELREVRLDHLLTKGSGGEVVSKEDLWGCLFGLERGKGRDRSTIVGRAGEDVGVVGRFLAGEAAVGRE